MRVFDNYEKKWLTASAERKTFLVFYFTTKRKKEVLLSWPSRDVAAFALFRKFVRQNVTLENSLIKSIRMAVCCLSGHCLWVGYKGHSQQKSIIESTDIL